MEDCFGTRSSIFHLHILERMKSKLTSSKKAKLAAIPQVSQILNRPELKDHLAKYRHEFVVAAIQAVIDEMRQAMLSEETNLPESRPEIEDEIVARTLTRLNHILTPSLKRVVNATGIILHTGLGRAPLPREALANIRQVADGYCNLELDLETGQRGQRTAHVEELLCQLTGAEAACVVNNNAAAVLLVLNTLAFGKETIVSRGQLVEIGGSFRIPEVMAKSGTRMVEVGATNKTHLRDYDTAISEQTALICVVHPSNYRVHGFTTEVELEKLVNLAHARELPLMQDLGGGILVDLREFGLPYEPVAQQSIEIGVDVVTFSGDKVLGGPQSGIIIGKKQYLDQIKTNPLMRALRCDKLVYAALEPTLRHYLQKASLSQSSQVFAMLLAPLETLGRRAEFVLSQISAAMPPEIEVSVADSQVQMGSGALPLESIPSKAICLACGKHSLEYLARACRTHDPPVVGYIRDNRLFFDLRTIMEGDEAVLIAALSHAGQRARQR